jgi:hypothetical protein
MHLACLQVFTSEVTLLINQRSVLVALNLVSLSRNVCLCFPYMPWYSWDHMGTFLIFQGTWNCALCLKLCLPVSTSFILHNGNTQFCFYCLSSYVSFKTALQSNNFEFQIGIFVIICHRCFNKLGMYLPFKWFVNFFFFFTESTICSTNSQENVGLCYAICDLNIYVSLNVKLIFTTFTTLYIFKMSSISPSIIFI